MKVKKLSIQVLDAIVRKQLQKVFTIWAVTRKFIRDKMKIQCRKMDLTINSEMKSRKVDLPKSPIEISNRLYSKAKEIQQKKDSLVRMKTQEFSFTPKVNGSAGGWEKIKNGVVKGKGNQEPLAVVSAQSVCSELQTSFKRSLTPVI